MKGAMRQFTMTTMALAVFGATAARAKAEKRTARPSQAVRAATVYCAPKIYGGRCYDDWHDCANSVGDRDKGVFGGWATFGRGGEILHAGCWPMSRRRAACTKKANGNLPLLVQCMRETGPRCFGC
jgi:hypothetical protein